MNPKMYRISALLALCAPLLLPSTSFAQGSDGTRGGGKSIEIRGVPHLSDLYDHCFWKEGSSLKNREFDDLLSKLNQTHWLFAETIRSELMRIRVCVTPNGLKNIRTDGHNGFEVIRVKGKQAQVAIRYQDLVFLDEIEFARLPKREQGLLLMHEILHSFIPSYVSESFPARPDEVNEDHVRNLNNAISENALRIERGSPLTPAEFALQLEMSGYPFATTIPETMKAPQATALRILALYGRTKQTNFSLIDLFAQLRTLNESAWDAEGVLWPSLHVDLNEALYQMYKSGAVAIKANQEEALKAFLKNGVPIHQSDASLLELAIQLKRPRLVEILVQNGIADRKALERAIAYLVESKPTSEVIFQALPKITPFNAEFIHLISKVHSPRFIAEMIRINSFEPGTVIPFLLGVASDSTLADQLGSALQMSGINFNEELLGNRLYLVCLNLKDAEGCSLISKVAFDSNAVGSGIEQPVLYSIVQSLIADSKLNEVFLDLFLARKDVKVSRSIIALAFKAGRYSIVSKLVAHSGLQAEDLRIALGGQSPEAVSELTIKVLRDSTLTDSAQANLVGVLLSLYSFDKLYLMNLRDQVEMVGRQRQAVIQVLTKLIQASGAAQ